MRDWLDVNIQVHNKAFKFIFKNWNLVLAKQNTSTARCDSHFVLQSKALLFKVWAIHESHQFHLET